ncbi:MAG: hypothetical protein OXD43_06465 [Bacteroidetes bacterium]|nr:hypothetical protein [Bacteroidota bacterium]
MLRIMLVFVRIVGEATRVRLLLILFGLATFLAPPIQAQSTVGVGLVFSNPYTGGVSVRYKPVQVLVASFGGGDDGFYIDMAARYNHPVKYWKRVRINLFGQVGRQGKRGESILERYRFTAGVSADLSVFGKLGSKGLILSADTGLSVDHLGNFGSFPGLGIGLHLFF